MNDNNAPHYTELPIAQLEENKGQIDGLPANPRNIQPDKLAKLKRSILDNPEMLQLRGILVYPHGDKYIVIGGNMRLRAMVELGMTSAPCVVIPSHVTADKLRAYTILDNSSMGEWDWQALQLEWDTAQLDDWGIDLPDFTDEEDEDAIASEDDYEMPEGIEEVETDIQQGDLIILEGARTDAPPYVWRQHEERPLRHADGRSHSRPQSDKNNSPINLHISQDCYTFVLSKQAMGDK